MLYINANLDVHVYYVIMRRDKLELSYPTNHQTTWRKATNIMRRKIRTVMSMWVWLKFCFFFSLILLVALPWHGGASASGTAVCVGDWVYFSDSEKFMIIGGEFWDVEHSKFSSNVTMSSFNRSAYSSSSPPLPFTFLDPFTQAIKIGRNKNKNVTLLPLHVWVWFLFGS